MARLLYNMYRHYSVAPGTWHQLRSGRLGVAHARATPRPWGGTVAPPPGTTRHARLARPTRETESREKFDFMPMYQTSTIDVIEIVNGKAKAKSVKLKDGTVGTDVSQRTIEYRISRYGICIKP